MKKIIYIIGFFISLVTFQNSFAATATLGAGQTATSWTQGGGVWTGGAGVNGGPAAGDDVVFANGSTFTADASINLNSIAINNGNATTTVNLTGGYTINVTNAITITASNTNNIDRILNIGTSTVTAASVTYVAGTGNAGSDTYVLISTGTLTVTGNFTLADINTKHFISFSGAGLLQIGGTLNIGASTTGYITSTLTTGVTAATSGTVEFNTASASNVNTDVSYYNLKISTGAKTLDGATSTTLTVNNNLDIASGSLNFGDAATVNVTGTTSIAGTITFNNATTTTATLTGSLSGAGTIDMSGGSLLHTLNLGGATNAIGTFTTAAVASTVNYNRAGAQTVFSSANYRNLTISNSGTKTLSGTVTVGGNLDVSGTATLDSDQYQITGNGSGTCTVGATAFLSLGNTGNATDVLFPTLFPTANITLTAGSTVTYKAQTAQSVSATPSYSNLTINNTVNALTATVVGGTSAATTLTVGNVLIIGTANNTLNLGTTITAATVTSTTTLTGTLDFSSTIKAVTLTGSVSGGGTITMQGAGIAHSLILGGVTNTVGTLNTTAASGSTITYNNNTATTAVFGSTNYQNLVITGAAGFRKDMSANVSVAGTLTINTGAIFNPAGADLSVTGLTTIIGTLGDRTAAGTNTFGNVEMQGGTISANGQAVNPVSNIGGTLLCSSGTCTLIRHTLTVTSTTTVSTGAAISITDDNTVKTFGGQVILQGTGTFTSTSVATSGNLIFQGGIDASNTATFNAAVATFNTADQTLTSTGTYNFSGVVTVTGAAVEVTNNGTVNITSTAAGSLTGTGGWIQGNGSVLNYAGSTITLSGTVTFNTPTNTVNYNRGGNATVFDTHYYNLAINANGTKTLTMTVDRNVLGTLTITTTTPGTTTSVFAASAGFNFTVTGTTTVNQSCTFNGSGNHILGAVTLDGVYDPSGASNTTGTITFSGTGNRRIGGATGTITAAALNVTGSDGNINDVILIVSGTTTVDNGYTLNITSAAGSKRFDGLVWIKSNSSWVNNVNENITFRGGLTFDGTAFTSGTGIYTFNTNAQDLDGTQSITFNGDVTVNGITLDNKNDGTVTIAGQLDGTGTWRQRLASTLTLSNATRPFNTSGGFLDGYSVTEANTVNYTGASPGIYCGGASGYYYYNLNLSGTGTSTMAAATSVYGTLGLYCVTTNSGTLTMATGSTIIRDGTGVLSAAPTFAGTVNVTYTGTVSTNVEMPTAPGVLTNLTINNASGLVTLAADIQCNGTLTLSSGNITLGSYNLTMAEAATFSGAFDNTKMIITDGSGKIKKIGDAQADFVRTYPLGTGTYYTPFDITALTAVVAANSVIGIRAIAATEPNITGYNTLSKYWEIGLVSGTVTVSSLDANYNYNNSEVVGTQANYRPVYWNGAITDPTAFSAAGVKPLATTANAELFGNWTGRDPAPATPQTWYTYGGGSNNDFDDPLNWTLDPTGVTLSPGGGGIPGANALDHIVILNGKTIDMVGATILATVTINSGGTLNLNTTTGHNWTSLSGQGLLRLNSVTLPTADLTAFVASTGGTIEYYDVGGVGGTSLPVAQTTYCNLLLTNSTATNHKLILPNTSTVTYTFNGTITTSRTGAGTLTFELGNTVTNAITINSYGDITNGSGCSMTVGAFSNTFHGINMDECSFVNNGTVDFANNSQYTASTVGAVSITFLGNTDEALTCNGQTDIYEMVLNTDAQANVLEVTGSAATNLKFYGANPITITRGTLKLTSGYELTGNPDRMGNATGATTFTFTVPANGHLWINGCNINTEARHRGFSILGKFTIDAGSFRVGGAGINIGNGGIVTLNGGTTTLYQLRAGGNGVSNGSLIITGSAVLNIDGSLTSTGFDADVPAIGLLGGVGLNFTQSGGTVNVSNVIHSTIGFGGIAFGINASNASVTGGAWVVDLPTTADFYLTSTVPFYDLTIKQTGAFATNCYLRKMGGNTLVAAQTLTVLNDFTLGTGSDNAFTFYADGNAIAVGGDFVINSDATFNPSGGTVTFNGPSTYGSAAQNFTLGTNLTESAALVVNKTSGTLTLGGAGTISCLKSLTITQGTFDDGGKVVNVCGDISNSGTHTSSTPATGEIRIEQGVRDITGESASGEATISTSVPNGTNAQFDLTFKDGWLVDIALVAGQGGSGYSNGFGTITITTSGAGAGATARCEIAGGAVVSAWVTNRGTTRYTPQATTTGSAVLESVYTYRTTEGGAAANPNAFSITVLNHGPNYAAAPVVTCGAATATADISTVPTVGGSGSGTFVNLSQNNLVGCTFTANQSMSGDLRLAKGIMNIASYNLSLGANSDIYDALAGATTAALGVGNTQFIKTGGVSTDGGVTKNFDVLTSFTFPIGTGTDYRQADFTFSADQPANSLVTVRGVASEHPNVTTTGMSLTYYWKTTTNSFVQNGTVDQVYHYVIGDVVDDAGDRTEADYVPGRYNPNTVTWAEGVVADVDEIGHTVTFQGATFNTSIDGHYTAGDNDNDNAIGVPFGPVTIYYSKASGDWDVLSTWSTVSHVGADATTLPSSNSVVQIGDGAGNNHNVSVTIDARSCGQLTLSSGSSLNLGTSVGHNFGGTISGTGTLKISDANVDADGIADFPAGAWTTFLGNTGGTVEYYTTGAIDFKLPTTSDAPSSLSLANYNNLIFTPATGRYIEMPDLAMTIYTDMTVQGASATGVVRMNDDNARALSIGDDLVITSGNLQFRNGTVQSVTVADDLSIGATGIFDLSTAGTAVTNTLSIGGSLSNAGTFDMWNATGPYLCNVTFTGTGNETISGAGATTDFSFLTVNKGTNQTPVLDYTASAFTFSNTTAASCFLVLTNGTFKLSSASTYTVALTTTSANCTIPSTAQFFMNAANVDVRVCYPNSNGDLYLDGKLRIDQGDFIIGNAANNRNNDLEYNQIGSPTLEINGGTLYVNGFLRRPTTTTAGNLSYTQTAGTVTIGGRNQIPITTRGIFEVTNSGTFTMSNGTIILERAQGNTVQDYYMLPTSSTVSGGTVQFGSATASAQSFTIYSTAQFNNLTVDGTSNTATLNTAGVTINGNLTINSTTAVFNANSLAVTIKGNLTSVNTTAATSVTTGGYRAGSTTQTTTFGGTSGQDITGASVNLGFGAVSITNTNASGIELITGVTPITVYGALTIGASANFICNNNTCTVNGNVSNSGTHTSASNSTGGIVLAGSSQQTITGNGSGIFGYLHLNNASGAILTAAITVNTRLQLQTGVFEIASYLLTLGSSADIYTATSFSSTLMVKMGGTLGDAGIIKNFPTGATNFTYPIGVNTKYTPANFNITANTATGTITVKAVNVKHPSTQDAAAKELNYYWNVTSTGFAGLTLTHTYRYIDASAGNDLGAAATEASCQGGRFVNSDWDQINIGTVNAGIDEVSWSAVSFITGDYTVGEATEFTALLTYYSGSTAPGYATGGNWDDANSWSTTAHGGAPAAAAPLLGNPIIIANTHTISANGNSRTAGEATINGTLDLGSYVGHNLGTVTGTGTLKIASTGATFKWPAGSFTSFVASTGGTVEYYGATTGAIEATQTSYNNLVFSGASTKTWPTGTYTVNGSVTISAGTVSLNAITSTTWNLAGNWTNSAGSSGFSAGVSTVNLNGSASQTITNAGGETFYNLTVSNSHASGIAFSAATDVLITNTLNMSDGDININGRTLTLGNSAAATLTYTNGLVAYGGTWKRWFPTGAITSNSGSYHGLFPIGPTAAKSRPITLNTSAGNQVSTAGYLAAVWTDAGDATDVNYLVNGETIDIETDMYVTITRPGPTTMAKNHFGHKNGSDHLLAGQFTLGVQFTDLSGSGSLTHMRLVNGAATTPGAHGTVSGSVSSPLATRTTLSAANLVQNWKLGSINLSATPLPVNLVNFEVVKQGEFVNIDWATLSETNSDYFEVERSNDGGITYNIIGNKVLAAGNSSVKIDYQLVDKTPQNGINYYRLKQVDRDAKTVYYGPIAIDFASKVFADMTVFPNPVVGNQFSLGLLTETPQEVLIVVKDIMGNEVFSKIVLTQTGNNLYIIARGEQMSPGIYHVIATNKSELMNRKIVIE